LEDNDGVGSSPIIYFCKNMQKKFFDDNQCRYCGRYESKNKEDGKDWWFGVDEDMDKVCDRCISALERLVEQQEKKNRAKGAKLNAVYSNRSEAAKKAWETKRAKKIISKK
jgi:hypothetical protein